MKTMDSKEVLINKFRKKCHPKQLRSLLRDHQVLRRQSYCSMRLNLKWQISFCTRLYSIHFVESNSHRKRFKHYLFRMMWLESIEKDLIQAIYDWNGIDALVHWASKQILGACNHFMAQEQTEKLPSKTSDSN